MLDFKEPNIKIADISEDKKYGRFVVEPLERGYGTTLGNSLRRIMLSSLPGTAVSHIRIDGVGHEFSAIPGVKEDVTEIIMNIKSLAIKNSSETNEPKTAYIEFEGEGVITAADIHADSDIEILNPDQVIATLSGGADSKFYMELTITKGRGYISADKNKSEDLPIGVLAVDSIYTPVERVNMTVENTRVGQVTDYDKLTLDVYTNGTLAPDEAVSLAAKVLSEHLSLFIDLSENAKQAMSKSIENILNSKGIAFERVIEQYNRLLELDKKGIDAKFIDENIYKSFVSSKTREWNDFALLCLVLVIGVPYVFSPEYKNGMINLIRTTENGKTKLFFGKIVVECIYLLIAFTALYVPYFVRFINTYGANSLNTPLVCIFENVQETSFSVINAVVVNLICYFLLATAVTFVITAVSIFTRSSMFTMVVSTVLVILPLLALYSIENVRIGYWVVNSHIIAIVMTCLLSILIAIVTLEISKLKFTETRIWRRINAKA